MYLIWGIEFLRFNSTKHKALANTSSICSAPFPCLFGQAPWRPERFTALPFLFWFDSTAWYGSSCKVTNYISINRKKGEEKIKDNQCHGRLQVSAGESDGEALRGKSGRVLRQIALRFASNRRTFCVKTHPDLRQNGASFCVKSSARFASNREKRTTEWVLSKDNTDNMGQLF